MLDMGRLIQNVEVGTTFNSPFAELSWDRIKKALVEDQKPTTSTGSSKLQPCEACLRYQELNDENTTEFGYCPRCGRQLRAALRNGSNGQHSLKRKGRQLTEEGVGGKRAMAGGKMKKHQEDPNFYGYLNGGIAEWEHSFKRKGGQLTEEENAVEYFKSGRGIRDERASKSCVQCGCLLPEGRTKYCSPEHRRTWEREHSALPSSGMDQESTNRLAALCGFWGCSQREAKERAVAIAYEHAIEGSGRGNRNYPYNEREGG